MKLQVQFPGGYGSVNVDTTNGTCAVFEKLTATEAATALEAAAMGDEDERGWIAAEIGGEQCAIRRVW